MPNWRGADQYWNCSLSVSSFSLFLMRSEHMYSQFPSPWSLNPSILAPPLAPNHPLPPPVVGTGKSKQGTPRQHQLPVVPMVGAHQLRLDSRSIPAENSQLVQRTTCHHESPHHVISFLTSYPASVNLAGLPWTIMMADLQVPSTLTIISSCWLPSDKNKCWFVTLHTMQQSSSFRTKSLQLPLTIHLGKLYKDIA